MNKENIEIAEKYIPHGQYCYTYLGTDNGRMVVKNCPYWSKTDNGFVVCLLTGDVSMIASSTDINDEQKSNLKLIPEEALDAVESNMLLWDQIKCCEINVDVEHDCHSCGKCSC